MFAVILIFIWSIFISIIHLKLKGDQINNFSQFEIDFIFYGFSSTEMRIIYCFDGR